LNESRVPFSWPLRVYWEDTDAGGVVYHARYVAFLERARSEWLRWRGIGQRELADAHDVVFAVRSMQLDFLAPAKLDDALEVQVDPLEAGRASLEIEQRIVRPADGKLLLTVRVKLACLAAQTFRPRGIPPFLLPMLNHQ
jgi:acyl-CoA thioester hydrolase